jgi:DNA-binding MltR family transcriptional regulator
MSNRKALRKLSKRFPPPTEVKNILESLEKESDRSCAIIASALLEAALEKLIIRHLKNSTPAMLMQIFENRGPLSDFHSKILVATAFGILNDQIARELHAIKAIRNVFAHSKSLVSFDTKEISQEIDSSQFIVIVRKHMKEVFERGIRRLRYKGAFLIISEILFYWLDRANRGLGGDPLAL